MGQYHVLVNLDKQECVWPHPLGAGLKIWEQIANGGYKMGGGVGGALLALLAVSSRDGGRGGGDIHEDPDNLVGSWGGDRIVVIGDYAEDDDLPPEFMASTLYTRCHEEASYDDGDGKYPKPEGPWMKDITPKVASLLEMICEGVFVGDGWKDFKTVRCPECDGESRTSYAGGSDGRICECDQGHKFERMEGIEYTRTRRPVCKDCGQIAVSQGIYWHDGCPGRADGKAGRYE